MPDDIALSLPTRHNGIVQGRPFSGLQVRSQSEAGGHPLSRPKLLDGETLGMANNALFLTGLQA